MNTQSPPVHRHCPVCGQDRARPHWRKGELSAVRCSGCTMVYANPVAAELVSGAFYDALGEPFYLSPAKLESDYSPVRFIRERRLFRRHCREGRVLDVGCSTGAFLVRLRENGYEVAGTDVAGPAIEHAARQGLAVWRGDFLSIEFGAEQFDAITFWAVLEHVIDPRGFLLKAATLLRPGGWCFVLVPNLRSLAVRLLGPKYRYVMAEHLNYFTGATLRAMAAAMPEFRAVEMQTMHFNPVVIWQDFWRPQVRVPDQARAELLRKTTALKQRRGLGLLRAAYSASERVLGKLGLADNLVIVLRKSTPS